MSESVSVGAIHAELTLDDTRFQAGLQEGRTGFTTLQAAAQRAATEVDSSFRNTGAQIERGGLGARNAARDVQSVGTAAQGAARDVGRVGDAGQDAARGVGRVGDAARDAAGDVSRIGTAARDAAGDVDRIERAADSASTATRSIDIPSGLSRAARDAADAVSSIGDAADDAGDRGGETMGGGFLGGFTDKIKGLSGAGGPIAGALLGVGAIGVAAGALLVKSIGEGMEKEKAIDTMQARLGINAATAKMLGTAAGGAFANGWGESVEANTDTATQLMHFNVISGEETSAEMQAIIEKATAVNELMGEDMMKTGAAVSAMLLNDMAPDAATAFDLITKSFQRGGNIGEDLLDSIREYSNGWKNAGFSAQFSLGLVNQALANGADWADRPADAIREFGRRLYEEEETIKESLGEINKEVEGLGMPIDEMFDRLAAGGPDAEAAFDEVFDAIRQIEDPLARNNIIMGLLGDTSGDFIDAFAKWDPSAAADGMRNVAGAADEAMRTMSDNAASDMTAAQNSITVAADEIKMALASAFGPELQKAATWVSEHKPEMISFFTGLADAGLACLEGMIVFASGSLRAFASMQEGIGDVIGGSLENMGYFTETVGGLIAEIPGMGDVGEAIQSAGAAAGQYGSMMNGAADSARNLADMIDGALPNIGEIRESVRSAGEQAANAAELTRLFGGEVTALPEGKSLMVEALTEEATQRLRDFGYTVEQLPDGTSRITANTADGQAIIDDFVQKNDGRDIDVDVWAKLQGQTLSGSVQASRADGGIDVRRYADGKLPDQATIKPATPHLVQWAEPETEGEAFIPLAQSKRARSTAILADVAARFGLDLMQRFADGGLRGDDLTEQTKPIEGARYVFGGWDGSWNTDCTGAASMVANMAAYGDPLTGGRFATGNAGPALASRGFLPGAGPDGSLRIGWVHDPSMPGGGHAAITLPDGNNVEMGGDRGDGQFGGKAAGAMDFPEVMHYPMPGSVGPGTSKKYDPKKAAEFNAENDPDGIKALAEAGDFTDRFGKKFGVAEDDPLVAAFLSGEYDGEADPTKLGAGNDPDGLRALMGAGDFTGRFGDKFGVAEDDPLVDALLTVREERKKAAEAAKADAAKADRPSTSSSSSGGVQDVRVTNWPEQFGGTGERQPAATLSARWYADGTEDHRAQIAPAGDMRVWAEPETGGEAYIPLADSKRPRSTAILAQVANRFGLRLSRYAVGGFGGVGQDGEAGTHTGSWEVSQLGEHGGIPLSSPSRSVPLAVWGAAGYRAVAAGIGTALGIAGSFDETGKFTGFDEGNTAIPGLDAGLERLSEQLTVLIEAVRDGKPVDVEVDIDSGRRTAELNIVQRGV